MKVMYTTEYANLNDYMIIAVVIAIYLKQLQINPKNLRDFNGIRTHGLCFKAAVL